MKLPKIDSCDRAAFIAERARGKKTLHLGCADWPFTDYMLRQGGLLHQRLAQVTDELVGLDLEPEGVRLMRAAGIPNILLGNSEDPLDQLTGEKFDLVVAGEVIEHVLNPGLFLESIKRVCHVDTILILTTVNYAPIKRLPRLLLGREEVHPDHVYYFSYSTLSCLLAKCGYRVEEWRTHWWDVGTASRLVNRVLRRIPAAQYYADNLCLVARPALGQRVPEREAA
jgi:SAM-dependent methyltransferase